MQTVNRTFLLLFSRLIEAISRPQIRFEGKAKFDEVLECWFLPQYSTTPVLQNVANQCIWHAVDEILRARRRRLWHELSWAIFERSLGFRGS